MKISDLRLILFMIYLSCSMLEAQEVTDIDGNVYRTVQIGNQTWMAEDLRTTHYKNGEVIILEEDRQEWNRLKVGGYCWYDNSPPGDIIVYGALYNFRAAYTQYLCPYGWHVPNNEEWEQLKTAVGGRDVAGEALKENALGLWGKEPCVGNQDIGFNAVPAGRRFTTGPFERRGQTAFWWSWSTERANSWKVSMNDSTFSKSFNYIESGLSIRCIKDQ